MMQHRVLLFLAELFLALCQIQIIAASVLTRDYATNPPEDGLPRKMMAPKVMIINLFSAEANIWYSHLPSSGLGNLTNIQIPLPLLSPIYPAVRCEESEQICQLTAGEGEINAAASISGLLSSPKFNFSRTYFLISGIAGVNPKLGTLGSVALAKFAVQVALQYEVDAREMPGNFTTGYMGYGTNYPNEYPKIRYGTEVMELNEDLRDAAYALACNAKLSDSNLTASYRAKYYGDGQIYAAATEQPSVLKCDTATSDVYYSGTLLSEAFENTTRIWTNQTETTYCMTAQEDNAMLQVLMRAHLARLADYSRIIVMRSGSNFDRPPTNISAFEHLCLENQNGFELALENSYIAGIEIVAGILAGWNARFNEGIQPKNYIGDIFGSLGGQPDFGQGSDFDGLGAKPDGSTYDPIVAEG